MFSFIPKNQQTTRNLHTLPIPAEVRAKDGYGDGINKDMNNHIRYEDDGKRTWNRRVGKVDLGTLDWRIMLAEKNIFRAYVMGLKSHNTFLEPYKGILLDKYSILSNVHFTNLDDKSAMRIQRNIVIRDTAYTDAASFKAAMSGVMLYYELEEPIIEDISDILPADNYIEVEGGGTLTFTNEYEYDVPSEVVYQLKEATA